MPSPRIASEIDFIADYLQEQLTALRYSAYGLSDAQARATPCTSTLSIGGVLKHTHWVMTAVARRRANPSGVIAPEDFAHHAESFYSSFALTEQENLADTLQAFELTAAAFIADVRATDPDAPEMAPAEPWWGRPDPTPTTARFHLLHLIEEFARHAGHADIIREQIDGATAIELAFGIEGRAGNDFVTPWQPHNG